MHTDEPREVQGVELGYDPRDINLPVIKKIVIWFFVFTLFFFGVGAAIFTKMGWGARTSFDTRKAAFDGPKVQGNMAAKIDIMDMRQTEREQMENYKEGANGTWRIPVDHAIDLLAERGLPKITSDKPAESKGNTIEQNATGPAPSSTPTSPADTGAVPTPDRGDGATGTTAGGNAPGGTNGGGSGNAGGTGTGGGASGSDAGAGGGP